jgi:predicted regulator of Ras-like GTPase activity (Roadblock/LC7/MglB family)
VGLFTSIAVGADGLPVISYWDGTGSALKVAKCANAACTGGSTITTVDTGNVGLYTSIAIGADSLPVISYQDNGAQSLKVAKCANAACTGASTITTVDDPVNFVGVYTSIAIGADGLPVISYQDFSANALKVVKCANPACTGLTTITTVDAPANSVGLYTSIAIGTDGLPVISYQDSTAGALKVAKCANAACTGASTITTVDDPANSVGRFTSIKIGTDGLPVISYEDQTAGTLKVAKCANAACTGASAITTVDDPANSVGQHTSIAVGADGLPVISYHDATAGALKVTKCGTRSCQ